MKLEWKKTKKNWIYAIVNVIWLICKFSFIYNSNAGTVFWVHTSSGEENQIRGNRKEKNTGVFEPLPYTYILIEKVEIKEIIIKMLNLLKTGKLCPHHTSF